MRIAIAGITKGEIAVGLVEGVERLEERWSIVQQCRRQVSCVACAVVLLGACLAGTWASAATNVHKRSYDHLTIMMRGSQRFGKVVEPVQEWYRKVSKCRCGSDIDHGRPWSTMVDHGRLLGINLDPQSMIIPSLRSHPLPFWLKRLSASYLCIPVFISAL